MEEDLSGAIRQEQGWESELLNALKEDRLGVLTKSISALPDNTGLMVEFEFLREQAGDRYLTVFSSAFRAAMFQVAPERISFPPIDYLVDRFEADEWVLINPARNGQFVKVTLDGLRRLRDSVQADSTQDSESGDAK